MLKNIENVAKRDNDMKVTEMKSSPERPNSHNVSFRMLYNTRTCPGSTSWNSNQEKPIFGLTSKICSFLKNTRKSPTGPFIITSNILQLISFVI